MFKINARDCVIKDVNKKVEREFLNNNHVQGFVKGSTVCYGLYLNDELVQIMSLGNQDIVSHINGNLLEIVLRKIILLEVVSLGFGNIS